MMPKIIDHFRHQARYWRGALREARGSNDPDPKYSSVIISREPLILRIAFYDHWTLFPLLEALRDRPVYLLYRFTWHFETPERISQLVWETRLRRKQYPNHIPIFLCNSDIEAEAIRANGLEAHRINNNCFVDENLYKPDPSVSKRFDAIYDAKLDGYKRHQLAEKVKSLALVTYLDGDPGANAHACDVRRRLGHAVWHNDPFSDAKKGFIPDRKVPGLYSEARVGLALSAEEGQMFASIQYLLVGLPVVSTHSLGGRDFFFDQEVARIVDADADAVADAVADFVKNPPDPLVVREKTIQKMTRNRREFVALVQSIYDREGCKRSYAEDFSGHYYNRFMSFRPKSDLIKELGMAGSC